MLSREDTGDSPEGKDAVAFTKEEPAPEESDGLGLLGEAVTSIPTQLCPQWSWVGEMASPCPGLLLPLSPC